MSEDNTNTYVGFMFFVLLVLWAAATWGDPDLIDALIYYLSDGHYKHKLSVLGLSELNGEIGGGGSIIC